jgi:protocatechuate 3,4-dioxygenase beta subunit
MAAAGLSIPRAVATPIAVSWIRATARAAARFAARESLADLVPASVASLAQGMLTSLFRSTLKLASLGLFTASLGVLGVGMAVRAHGPVDLNTPPDFAAAQAPAAAPPQPKAQPVSKPRPDEIRGVVIDEAGRPVPGTTVKLFSLNAPSVRSESRKDGSFALPLPDRAEGTAYRVLIIATHDDGRRQASQEILLRRGRPTPAARLVLKTALELTVRAEDGLQRPVPGAAIEVLSGFSSIGRRSTGNDGLVSMRLPADLGDFGVIGLKSHVGFDYFNFSSRRTWPFPIDATTTIPKPIRLALDGVRPLRMKVVEADGSPAPGIELAISTVTSEGREDGVLLSASEIARATSDADGIATFDWLPTRWLPADRVPSAVMPMGIHFVRVRLKTKGLLQDREHFIDSPTANRTSEFRVLRPTRISGRVLDPDGKPAAGITIIARGRGSDPPEGRGAIASGRVLTDNDGRYALEVRPETFTMIGVEDRQWAATSRKGIFIEPGKPRDDVDFRLVRGTILRGRVLNREGKPIAGASLILSEDGDDLSGRVKTPTSNARRATLLRTGSAGVDGRYVFRVGPGRYWLSARNPNLQVSPPAILIDIGDEESIEQDVRIVGEPRPPQVVSMSMISGAVTDPDGRPIAGAIIWGINPYRTPAAMAFEAVSDDKGHFGGHLSWPATLVYAYSSDRSLATFRLIKPHEDKILLNLTPSVTARGRVVDRSGKPRAGVVVSVDWLMKQGGHDFSNYATTSLKTDADGRYSLGGLPVGASLQFGLDRSDEGTFQPFEATRSGTIEVKDIVLDEPARKPK